ncbi:MAG TPA: ice-binding family protein [Coriobacteriia bacterium]
MRSAKKMLRVPLLVAAALAVTMAVPTISMAAQPTVNLGTTSTFAVLAGSTITNVGPTTIGGSAGGDVGLHPGTAFTGQASVTISGAVHLADAIALIAKNDLITAYDDAAGRTPVTTIPTELGGTTLLPGVYDSLSGTFQITGPLTLDAQGDPDAVFVFKCASTLVTASGSSVNLINDARYCRVFWQVGTSATLGTNSSFVGHIFALTSIAAQTGATVQGQLLARNGAVTLDTNTITNGVCAAAATPLIRIAKTAAPAALTSGPGPVTYTYRLTNPGLIALSNVSVTDDKVSPVTYVSGDANGDTLLQPSETWVYTSTTNLTVTTTNTATATGTGSGTVVVDTARATVVVTPTTVTTPTTVVTPTTVTTARLPDTATPWYNMLLAGVVLALLGAVGLWRAARRSHG